MVAAFVLKAKVQNPAYRHIPKKYFYKLHIYLSTFLAKKFLCHYFFYKSYSLYMLLNKKINNKHENTDEKDD